MNKSKSRSRLGSSARESIFQSLRSKIISLELEPAAKISEKEIADMLDLSRTPVREAFLQLSQEGLLEIYPQSGTVVSRIDLKCTEEAEFIRTNLEIAVVRKACITFPEERFFQLESSLSKQEWYLEKKDYLRLSELDDEFHAQIFLGCGKVRTWSLIQQMNAHLTRIGMLRPSLYSYWESALLHHREILDCIQGSQIDKAVNLMDEHMKMAGSGKQEMRKRYPHYFL